MRRRAAYNMRGTRGCKGGYQGRENAYKGSVKALVRPSFRVLQRAEMACIKLCIFRFTYLVICVNA